MSTAIPAGVSSNTVISSRTKCLSFLKCQPHRYSPWYAPISERQLNATFEMQIMPELSRRLEHAFADLPEHEREDAVQDATCQALEAYRILRLGENRNSLIDADETSNSLAAYAANRYQSGVRFAAPRSAACL